METIKVNFSVLLANQLSNIVVTLQVTPPGVVPNVCRDPTRKEKRKFDILANVVVAHRSRFDPLAINRRSKTAISLKCS